MAGFHEREFKLMSHIEARLGGNPLLPQTRPQTASTSLSTCGICAMTFIKGCDLAQLPSALHVEALEQQAIACKACKTLVCRRCHNHDKGMCWSCHTIKSMVK